ncbi:MAG: hypothetical protein J6W25_00155 [Bacilli bacterium]|nr:hypothetical protein [Bacilli bacterium]MBO7535902.1 hypothetical protein [Bacilli bacterium]
MKKKLTISLLLFILLVFSACGTSYVMAASSTEENAVHNHYKFGAFKGVYTFKKTLSEDTTVRIVTYTEIEDVLYIKIKASGEVIHTMEVTKDTNDTYYIDLERGNYEFSLSSENVFKGELLFEWKYEK